MSKESEGYRVKALAEIYQAGRDIDGRSHSIVSWYDGKSKVVIVFPGYNGAENREAFIEAHCHGWDVKRNDHNEIEITPTYSGLYEELEAEKSAGNTGNKGNG